MGTGIAKCVAAIATIAFVGACTTGPRPISDRAAETVTARSLRTFKNMGEFDEYRAQLARMGKRHNVWPYAAAPRFPEEVLLAQNDVTPCDPSIQNCSEQHLSEIVLTAAKSTSRKASSITNTQEIDVDEGDIVKQYGRFLIVLQDGRLFSIDTGQAEGSARLIDRLDVYRSPHEGTWYDELLIHGGRLVVTGYSYDTSTSEIDVIAIDETGRLDLQARYEIESEDYYSGKNYASRLVRGQFVVYSPVDLVDLDEGEPLKIPRMRRWTQREGHSEWQPLFAITDVYRPIQPTLHPTLHVLSVCRLDPGSDFGCRSTGIIGPSYRELYVSSRHIYLWLSSDREHWAYGWRGLKPCDANADLFALSPAPAAVFQISIDEGSVRAAHALGIPTDQFAFDERENALLALTVRAPADCYLDERLPMQFAALPLNGFSRTPPHADDRRYRPLRTESGSGIQIRYTQTHAVYGVSHGYSRRYWRRHTPRSGDLVVVPIDRPSTFHTVAAPHTIERLEVVGAHALVAAGVMGAEDLGLSTLRADASSAVASTVVLPAMIETEGRSHAFNALTDEAGTGVFGLPAMYTSTWGQPHWWEVPANVQFFQTDSQLQITSLGELAGVSAKQDDYECEVSCEAWYGNSRPMFIGERVFALISSQLVEGQIQHGRMIEFGRLDLTGPPEIRR